MKKAILSFCLILLGTFFNPLYAKEPIVVEIETSYKTIREATMAAKKSLMSHKFIPNGGVNDNGFTATRTTGSKADYYTADVMTEEKGGKVIVTITFIKSGTGMLKLHKLGEEIKVELSGRSPSTGMQKSPNPDNTQQVAKTNIFQESSQSKCKVFSAMMKGGKVLLVVGGSLLISGLILYAVDGTSAMYAAGEAMMPIGVVAIGASIPLLIVGGKKSKQYCALQLKANPTSIAFAISLHKN